MVSCIAAEQIHITNVMQVWHDALLADVVALAAQSIYFRISLSWAGSSALTAYNIDVWTTRACALCVQDLTIDQPSSTNTVGHCAARPLQVYQRPGHHQAHAHRCTGPCCKDKQHQLPVHAAVVPISQPSAVRIWQCKQRCDDVRHQHIVPLHRGIDHGYEDC